jgi:hypothetical protein
MALKATDDHSHIAERIMPDLHLEVLIKLDPQIAAIIVVEDVEDKLVAEAAHESNLWTYRNSSTRPS